MTNTMQLYDNPDFFQTYAQMDRSRYGLPAAGEWPQMERLMPDLHGKRTLDLGCGYGWHSKYAADHGAEEILGIDISHRMIEEAHKRNSHPNIHYMVSDIQSYEYPDNRWDVALSNLVLHYVEDLTAIYQKIFQTLKPHGIFLFNIEHPVFTAGVRQEWVTDTSGKPLYWPVDDYFYSGKRNTMFLDCPVEKQHHTLTQIINPLMEIGFTLLAVDEVMPPETWRDQMPDEMRRPMMLLVKAQKGV